MILSQWNWFSMCPVSYTLGSLEWEPVLESTPWKGRFPLESSPFLVQGFKYLWVLWNQSYSRSKTKFTLGYMRPPF